MPYIITLIAAPGSGALVQDVINACLPKLADVTAAALQEPIWLAEGEACEWVDVALSPEGAHAVAQILKPIIADRPIDLHLHPAPNGPRVKALLVADMESTIIQEELIDELASERKLGPEIADVTARAMRGELEFSEALQARVEKFSGFRREQLDALFEKRVTLMPGAETLVRTMQAHGAKTALVSGGFSIFADRIADRLGFDHVHANTLGFAGETLTGEIIPPILDRAGKADRLQTLADAHRIDVKETIAVGDGANDLDMIDLAGLGVAFRAKPVVAAQGDIAVQAGDLTSLLYVQGITKKEFAAA